MYVKLKSNTRVEQSRWVKSNCVQNIKDRQLLMLRTDAINIAFNLFAHNDGFITLVFTSSSLWNQVGDDAAQLGKVGWERYQMNGPIR